MPKYIKDTSKKQPILDPEEIAKILGAKRVTPLEEILEDNPNYTPLGKPLLMHLPPFVHFEHAVQYLAGRYAAYNKIKREDIVAYRRLSYDETLELAKDLGTGNGFGIQFYTRK